MIQTLQEFNEALSELDEAPRQERLSFILSQGLGIELLHGAANADPETFLSLLEQALLARAAAGFKSVDDLRTGCDQFSADDGCNPPLMPPAERAEYETNEILARHGRRQSQSVSADQTEANAVLERHGLKRPVTI